MINKKLYTIFILAVLLLLSFFIFWQILNNKEVETEIAVVSQKNEPNIKGCHIETEFLSVRGNSMEPLIRSGDAVKVLFGYYECNLVNREDIVIFNFAGSEYPMIKIVKGIPGDRFELKETYSGWHILINDDIVKNSENKAYLIPEQGYRMLSLYERDFDGIIPKNAYLLLGDNIFGTLDSTRFGLIDRSVFQGKAIISKAD